MSDSSVDLSVDPSGWEMGRAEDRGMPGVLVAIQINQRGPKPDLVQSSCHIPNSMYDMYGIFTYIDP